MPWFISDVESAKPYFVHKEDLDEFLDTREGAHAYEVGKPEPLPNPRRHPVSDDKKPKTKIITPEFRGSYVTLVKPRAQEEGKEPKYSINIVLKKKAPETIAFLKRLEASFNASMIEKLGKAIPFAACKYYPVHDGDKPDEDGEVSDITKGCWRIYASNKFKPGCIDKAGQKLFSEEDLYSGAWYRASVSTWAWKNDLGGRGVSINLDNVMKLKDDDKYGGGGSKAEDDFAEHIEGSGTEEVEDDDDDMLK